MLIALLIVGALLLSYANGSNDNFKATATVYGSGTLGYRASLTLASVAQIAGSLASVALAGALLKAFSGKGLVPEALVADPIFLASVALGAASTVLLATRFGIPVSTTHALIGGLVGAGLALAPGQVELGALGAKYFVPLLVSPLLALVGAAIIYPLTRGVRSYLRLQADTCLCLGESIETVEVAADGTMTLQRTGLALSLDELGNCTQRYSGKFVGVPVQGVIDALHTFSAFSLGFARGLNDTPKVLALLVAAGWSGLDPRLSLVCVAGAMVMGGFLHSRRVAETMSHKITSITRGQGLVGNAVASSLVIGASLLGSPVSTTHVSTGAIFGIGLWSGTADKRVMGGLVLAWVATLPLGAALASVVALTLSTL